NCTNSSVMCDGGESVSPEFDNLKGVTVIRNSVIPSSEHAIIYRDSETPGEPVRFRNAVRTWLIKIVEGRYRCWEDFLTYGMVSAGHDNPPGPTLQLLSVGDEIYAFLSPRGYVGRGQVTKAAVLADYFVVDGDFIAKDGSGRFSRVMLADILLL